TCTLLSHVTQVLTCGRLCGYYVNSQRSIDTTARLRHTAPNMTMSVSRRTRRWPPRERLKLETTFLREVTPQAQQLFALPSCENVPVKNVWLEMDLPGDRWRVAFRLVPYGEEPVIAEIRVFPADVYPDRCVAEWRGEFLGVLARSM